MLSHRIDIIVTPRVYVFEPLLEGLHADEFSRLWRLVVREGWTPDLARNLRQSPADGYLIMEKRPAVVRAVRRSGKPAVAVRQDDLDPAIPKVLQDDVSIGRLAAEHLLAEGFTRFAYLGLRMNYSLLRWRGFTAALRDAGHDCIDNRRRTPGRRPQFPDYLTLAQPPTIRTWLAGLPKPIAVMACSDEFGSHLIDACEQAAIPVPAQVAVIGVDNSLFRCEFSPVTLTSIDPDLHTVGRRAAALLHQALQGRPAPSGTVELVPPLGVVKRRSTEWLSSHDPELDRALTLIRTQAHTGITIEHVLAEVPLSRTALEQRFKKQLNRTPGQELRRVRLDHATRLLRESDLSILQVAMKSGFSSSAYLCQALRQHTGMTPSTYRASRNFQGPPSDATASRPR